MAKINEKKDQIQTEEVLEQLDENVVQEAIKEEPSTDIFAKLFVEDKSSEVSNRGNQLSATAELTKLATDITNDILSEVREKPLDEELIEKSMDNHDAMDELVNRVRPLDMIPTAFLVGIDEEELDKMIRSQQSKRSRAKAKEKTAENYKTMMVAAVAEGLLRLAANKPKSGGGALGTVRSEEDYEALADDLEALKKAIRNVQSKKSIMKHKIGFSEEDPRWLELLEEEARLKSLRPEAPERSIEIKDLRTQAEAKQKAEQLLAELPADPNPEDAAEVLAKLKDILATE